MVIGSPNTVESAAVRARRSISGLHNLKDSLAIVEASTLIVIEGNTRTSATELAERASKEFKVNVTASVVGQLIRQMGINTVVSHGKSRLILDIEQLQSLKIQLTQKCESASLEVNRILAEFQGISAHVESIEKEWEHTVKQKARERELSVQIEQAHKTPSRLPALEGELSRLQKEAASVTELEKKINELSGKIKALPSLREREKSLESTINEYRTWEAEIVRNEDQLGTIFEQLKLRNAWITYSDLQPNIQKLKAELAQVSKQLEEKQSLLQRIIGGRRK
jgi:DNA repair exonuclease SbcCD ATPase subunit